MATLRKLRRLFDRDTKIKLLILLAAIIAGALLEMLAFSIIQPFITVLTDDSIIEINPYINWAYTFFGFTNAGSFLALLAFLLASVYVFRGLYLYALNRVQFRFIARRQAELSNRLLSKTLGFPYLYHTRRNIAELLNIIVDDVNMLFNMLTGFLLLAADFFMTLFILVFLLIVSPAMTLIVFGLSLLCVLFYMKKFRKQIRNAGKKRRRARIGMTKAVNQALGGIKEVKVLGRENYFKQAFEACSSVFVAAYTQYRVLHAAPKLVIESVCFGGAFISLGVFILAGAGIAGLIPQLSLFVLAAFRLLPAVSRQVAQVSNILYLRSSVDAVHKSLFEEMPDAPALFQAAEEASGAGQDIIVRDLSFQYPNTAEPVFILTSLTIPNKKSIALVGPSGAGKTTLADLILGILTPDAGGVYYEGKSIHQHFGEWVGKAGYIPQHIYLLDESIRENVAFGINKEKIDEAKVWRALDQAQLREFAESLPDGLNTIVGDRGVRLSGGQRQRMGIARAMYEDPPILVLDEATSSLDNETEKAVMDAVMGFKGNKTMVIVAHRLSTVKHCDITYHVDNKTVINVTGKG